MTSRESFALHRAPLWAEVYVRGSELVNLDTFSLSDPVAYMYMASSTTGKWVEVGRTEEVRDDLNPTWRTTFLVPVKPNMEAKFVVWDIDKQTDNLEDQDLIGEININLRPLVVRDQPCSYTGELICDDKPGRFNGYFSVTVVAIQSPEASKAVSKFVRARKLTGEDADSQVLSSFDWFKVIRKFHLSVLGPIPSSAKSVKSFSGHAFVRWLVRHVIATGRVRNKAKAMAQFLLDVNIIDNTHIKVFSSSKESYYVFNPYFLRTSFKASVMQPRYKLNADVYRSFAYNTETPIFVDELDAQALLPSHLKDSPSIRFGVLEPDAAFPPVMAGTLKALVTRMTHPQSPDDELVNIVLYTYPRFPPPHKS
ncbi:uncharacterized protein AMSG_11734 [Thecamonas trahens ATCC 50062]|uniref:C2 domain-containing protein n=1 Tax=Thecamonas trahens ATCC 50062 TaxID=461836 RepID=A0A0L0D2K2_THETB|nr:hypothetical protein AMSG_11734 [Thecamonas trahens ATCC 50062]KNC46416.1 hypothetical protein AMSG_11734 [Thecamonas trahens ATCC 50062]|eukprot:XP_013760757.1 hypothetical protein AMSG_11734 [Thecamonas trahens ATCC 50062]